MRRATEVVSWKTSFVYRIERRIGRVRSERVRPLSVAVLLLLALLSPETATADQVSLVLDPNETMVTFVLDATGHEVDGRLVVTSGEILFDPETGQASGTVEIDARKTDTGNARRDRKMHAKVLLSEQYPWIRFEAEAIEGDVRLDGASEFELHGTLTLLGKTHEVVLETRATIDAGSLRAEATLVVPYVEWGLEDPSVLILRVAKVVDVRIEAVGSVSSRP